MAINEMLLNRYNHLNAVAKANCAVFFGADFFSDLPLSELAADFGVDAPVYNRSVRGMSIHDAERALSGCIYELDPAKIFINIGDADLAQGLVDAKAFLSAYEWLLYTIHSHSRAMIHIVSILSSHPLTDEINRGLQKIAQNTGCTYVDITRAWGSDNCEVHSFRQLKYFLHDTHYTLSDMFNHVG